VEYSVSPYPKTVSFIVLALNEADNIKKTVETIFDAVSHSHITDYELILVNDGSNDGTGELMEKIAFNENNIFVVHNKINQGFGSAYLKGIQIATKEYAMIIAGDNIMPSDSIKRILNSVGTTDIILPYMSDARHRNKLRAIASWIFARLINSISKTKIKYYNSMVVRQSLFSKIQVQSTGYTLQAECVIKFIRNRASFCEIAVSHGHEFSKKPNSHALKIKNLINVFLSLKKLIKELSKKNDFFLPPDLN